MIKNEWKSLLKNKILLVVLAAIILIPAIYASLFLGSMWDPYGKLSDLPVAVVNKDKAVTYNGKELNVGSQLADNLSSNKSLKFTFVTESKALEGLENGNYYMVITIPQDFSANASTLMDSEPKKMELLYQTNPGTNYIASKLSESAMQKLKEAAAAEVTHQLSAGTVKVKRTGTGRALVVGKLRCHYASPLFPSVCSCPAISSKKSRRVLRVLPSASR